MECGLHVDRIFNICRGPHGRDSWPRSINGLAISLFQRCLQFRSDGLWFSSDRDGNERLQGTGEVGLMSLFYAMDPRRVSKMQARRRRNQVRQKITQIRLATFGLIAVAAMCSLIVVT